MKAKPQFIALLTYLSEENGGRKMPAMSGYRAAVKFPFYSGESFGEQHFMDVEDAFPGATVRAEMTLLDPERFKHKLYKGIAFDFLEGETIIGHGIVTEILDPEFSS